MRRGTPVSGLPGNVPTERGRERKREREKGRERRKRKKNVTKSKKCETKWPISAWTCYKVLGKNCFALLLSSFFSPFSIPSFLISIHYIHLSLLLYLLQWKFLFLLKELETHDTVVPSSLTQIERGMKPHFSKENRKQKRKWEIDFFHQQEEGRTFSLSLSHALSLSVYLSLLRLEDSSSLIPWASLSLLT